MKRWMLEPRATQSDQGRKLFQFRCSRDQSLNSKDTEVLFNGVGRVLQSTSHLPDGTTKKTGSQIQVIAEKIVGMLRLYPIS